MILESRAPGEITSSKRTAVKKGRAIVLLSLAEGLSARFVANAGRYAEGAVFAPGFYPDESDNRIGPFVVKFRDVYGEDPGPFDAYAYDAALCVRAVVERGARTRARVAKALQASQVEGVTGTIRFTPSRERQGGGRLFRVARNPDGSMAIRAEVP